MALRRQETIAVALRHHSLRNEGLLFHSRLGSQGSGHIVQIPDFISLNCRKGNRLEQTVSACGHPAVYAKRCRNIAGQIAIVPIKAFHIILVWLCDKGLHLHIVSGHQGAGHSVQVDTLIPLVDMVRFQLGRIAVRWSDSGLDFQRPFELLWELFPTFKGSAQDTQAGFPGQIVFVRRIVLQNLRQGRFFFFSGGHPSIERQGIATPGRNQFPIRFAQQIPSARCQVEGLKHHRL